MKTLHNLQTFCFPLILLIISYYPMVLAVEVTIPQGLVVGRAGSSVELPCLYNTAINNNFNVEWRFAPKSSTAVKAKQIFYYANGEIYKPGSQSERLSSLQNPPTKGSATLQLSELQVTDAGFYTCEVNNPPDFSGIGYGLVNLTVLVPPSTPSCLLNGQTHTGNNVILACSSSSGVPTPVYSWSLVGSQLNLPAGSLEDERSGNLVLTNLSLASSGTYRCEASNELGKATCDLTVTVTSNQGLQKLV
ncbi:V-set and immunoglobulin domain-containing protein 2 isoform X2 [Microcaecilia unicolor]|uniref:V-set and immunoglobulin domain-containing protein 2 isoform X2 n=1 Tax=Microcaecilia unicolor TaxID=1415580 RepID=UPI0011850A1A|nr:V-set and immunoglobulin domain-containing protein 2 isoform X2 [Microcaecilia unicolor]